MLAISYIRVSPVLAENSPFHLNIGFSRKAFVNVPKEDIKVAIQLLTQKVAKKTIGTADSQIYDSTDDIERDLKLKKIDVVAMTPEEFIYLRSHTPLEAVMTTVSGKSYEVEMFMLARKDSGLNSVTDLKHKVIALPSKNSQYGVTYHTWLETLVMKERAVSTGDFFTIIKETRNASQAAMAVFFRQADACVISSHAFDIASELNPQVAMDMKVISRISRLVGGIIAFRQDLPEERKQKVKKALMTLHEDQEGRQMFILFQLNSLTPFLPENMIGTDALYAEHRKLKARLMKK
jgi:ABC-type phosphate/phosphonate transport system substrate-binding protein